MNRISRVGAIIYACDFMALQLPKRREDAYATLASLFRDLSAYFPPPLVNATIRARFAS
jgi:hypothetical protein